jgi:hypothetical protein
MYSCLLASSKGKSMQSKYGHVVFPITIPPIFFGSTI